MDIEESGCSDTHPPARCGKAAVSIYRYFPHGGLQKSMMDIVLELQRRNFDVTIFCMSWESEKIPEKVTVRRLRISGSSSSAKAHKFDLALARVLKKRDFDFHLSFNKVSSADGYFVDDLPFVRTSGQIPLWRRIFSRRWRIYSSMEHQVFGKGNPGLIFCQSELQKRAYQNIYGTADERFRILPPGVEDIYRNVAPARRERRERTRNDLNIKDDEKALFFVASAFYAKGADRAIAALAALPLDQEVNAKLFIVGRNDETKLRRFAGRLGVDDRVFFLGARMDVPDLLCAADLLIHPARNEAAGIVLLEAICCGTPVLCTGNCGYAGQIIESGAAVVLKRPFSQRHLNRALRLLLTVPGSLDELQQSAAVTLIKDEFFRGSKLAADIIEERINRASGIE